MRVVLRDRSLLWDFVVILNKKTVIYKRSRIIMNLWNV